MLCRDFPHRCAPHGLLLVIINRCIRHFSVPSTCAELPFSVNCSNGSDFSLRDYLIAFYAKAQSRTFIIRSRLCTTILIGAPPRIHLHTVLAYKNAEHLYTGTQKYLHRTYSCDIMAAKNILQIAFLCLQPEQQNLANE